MAGLPAQLVKLCTHVDVECCEWSTDGESWHAGWLAVLTDSSGRAIPVGSTWYPAPGDPLGIGADFICSYVTGPDALAVVPQPTHVRPCGTAEPPSCAPSVQSTDGTAPQIAGIHALDVDNPTCCAVTVSTSIGQFRVPAGRAHHMQVGCPFDVQSLTVAGDCNAADVTLTGVRTS